ncbi:hypothetical protein [Flexibacterium corallicola]|uniref:hypothetical protein n=1 Tax=Flexibacterium corallicola TaxID=3037259 RepID=UPI00286F1004|nr:hypothetical protein [Pseudovibrio sp. M1P-2-3]
MPSHNIPLILTVILGLAACASAGNETLRSETQVSLDQKFEKGVTTKEQVKTSFGQPQTLNFTDSGNEVWKYRHVRAKAKATNFIPVVDLLAGGQDLKTKELALFFDTNGVLVNYSMTESKSEIRTGLITANAQ